MKETIIEIYREPWYPMVLAIAMFIGTLIWPAIGILIVMANIYAMALYDRS